MNNIIETYLKLSDIVAEADYLREDNPSEANTELWAELCELQVAYYDNFKLTRKDIDVYTKRNVYKATNVADVVKRGMSGCI